LCFAISCATLTEVAVVGPEFAGDNAEEGRFPAAVRPEHSGDLARANVQRNVVKAKSVRPAISSRDSASRVNRNLGVRLAIGV
jgi:hypothetical protein